MRNFIAVIISLIIIGLILVILFFVFDPKIEFSKSGLVGGQRVLDVLIEKKISITSPLKVLDQEDSIESLLTQQGVIQETNIQRRENGLVEFKENSKLNLMAQAKVNDMFEGGYFDHYSPARESVGDLADDFSYEFIAIGENLALGNFEDDKTLVVAWMNSPEHKANILNPQYKEIGVAVKKGMFNGRSVWLAVQHFGFAASECLFPSSELKEQIEDNENEIKEKQALINNIQTELSKIKPKWGEEYESKVDEYNNLIKEYNGLIDINKSLIEQYNNQVYNFNECIQG